MNTKAITITIAFAVIAIVLTAIKIPAIVLQGFNHRIYEIPIVIAFFLFGPKIGISVGFLHLVGHIIFFPAGLNFIAYPMGFVAILNMMLGIYLAKKLIMRKRLRDNACVGNRAVIYLTFFGTLSRVAISTILDYAILYRYLMPLIIGRSIPEIFILSTIVPGIFLFNAIVSLYTIPLSYFIAKKVNKNLKIVGMQQKAQEFGL